MIESSLTQSGRVERDRDNAIHRLAQNACILHRLDQIFRQDAAQVELAAIFEAVDQLA
ncbi:MAG: hypothetical protein JOZ61_02445 [Verrucomicrobia bacterium]|nr:hypothetical protein [Verrucomicrobiota bacterium]